MNYRRYFAAALVDYADVGDVSHLVVLWVVYGQQVGVAPIDHRFHQVLVP